MRIRTAFISNHSTTDFVIIGIRVDPDPVLIARIAKTFDVPLPDELKGKDQITISDLHEWPDDVEPGLSPYFRLGCEWKWGEWEAYIGHTLLSWYADDSPDAKGADVEAGVEKAKKTLRNSDSRPRKCGSSACSRPINPKKE